MLLTFYIGHYSLNISRLDFLNCTIFKHQPHVKKDISKSIYLFHVKLSKLLLTM